jgi:hypothetical protein
MNVLSKSCSVGVKRKESESIVTWLLEIFVWITRKHRGWVFISLEFLHKTHKPLEEERWDCAEPVRLAVPIELGEASPHQIIIYVLSRKIIQRRSMFLCVITSATLFCAVGVLLCRHRIQNREAADVSYPFFPSISKNLSKFFILISDPLAKDLP